MNTSSHNGYQVEEAFEVVAVDPVQEVKATVGAESEEVVRSDGLRLTSLADHEQLGQDGHRLQVDGESPQDLCTCIHIN